MTLSQLDVEALYLGSSFLMADPMGPLLDQDDEEEALSPSSSLEGKVPASPSLSFSSYTSSPSPYQTLSSSPPPSPPSLILGPKAELETLSLSWLGASELLESHAGAGVGNACSAEQLSSLLRLRRWIYSRKWDDTTVHCILFHLTPHANPRTERPC